MIKGINETKTLTEHISCKYKCKFDGTKCISDQWWKNSICRCEFKKRNICEKDYIWNPSTCICENGKYLESIIDNSVIICDEVKESYNEEIKAIPTNFKEKKAICKTQNVYILLGFY